MKYVWSSSELCMVLAWSGYGMCVNNSMEYVWEGIGKSEDACGSGEWRTTRKYVC